jgi:hypothetical protein
MTSKTRVQEEVLTLLSSYSVYPEFVYFHAHKRGLRPLVHVLLGHDLEHGGIVKVLHPAMTVGDFKKTVACWPIKDVSHYDVLLLKCLFLATNSPLKFKFLCIFSHIIWYMICTLADLTNVIQMTIAELIKQATSGTPGKRRHRRLSLRLPMDYSLPGSSRHRLAYTLDICEGGLLIHTPEKLEIGQNLRVKFYHVSGSGVESIQAPGEVVRIDRLEKSGKEYRCAVKFVDLPPDVLKNLQKFLKSLY